MRHFKIILFLLRLLPFNAKVAAGLRSHTERCEKCRQGLASPDEARAATLARDKLTEIEDFWPRLVFELKTEPMGKQIRRPALRPRWVLGTAGVLAAILGGLLFLTPRRPAVVGPLVKLRIDSVTIYGQPAQAFIFQTQDADSTFVWVEKQSSN
jgi:hypothetical protein